MNIAAVYLLLGLTFAVFFVIWGAGKIDPAAAEGTMGFRAIIMPGVVLLWPLLAKRWWQGARNPPLERNSHRAAAHSQNDKQ
ncbi:MAG: hypothetical protein ACREOO_03025 [bacterium]